MKKIFSLFIFIVTFVVFNSTANAGITILCTYEGVVGNNGATGEATIALEDDGMVITFGNTPWAIPNSSERSWPYLITSSGDSAMRMYQENIIGNNEVKINVNGSSSEKSALIEKGFCPSSLTFGLKNWVQFGATEDEYEIFVGEPQDSAYGNSGVLNYRYVNYTTPQITRLSQDVVNRLSSDMNGCMTDVSEIQFVTNMFNFSSDFYPATGPIDKQQLEQMYLNNGFDAIANSIVTNYSPGGTCYEQNPSLSSYYDQMVGYATSFLQDVDKEPEQGNDVTSCDQIVGNGTFKYYVNTTFKFIQYLGPVIAIILSTIEYIKAAALADSGALKSTNKKTIIRIIFTLLLFLIPVLVNVLLDVFGFYEHCDISHF